MADDNQVVLADGSTSYVGPDAVLLFRVAIISKAIRLYLKTGIRANRAYTPTAMRQAASAITSKPYKAGRVGLEQAATDLEAWQAAMVAAMPIKDERTKP